MPDDPQRRPERPEADPPSEFHQLGEEQAARAKGGKQISGSIGRNTFLSIIDRKALEQERLRANAADAEMRDKEAALNAKRLFKMYTDQQLLLETLAERAQLKADTANHYRYLRATTAKGILDIQTSQSLTRLAMMLQENRAQGEAVLHAITAGSTRGSKRIQESADQRIRGAAATKARMTADANVMTAVLQGNANPDDVRAGHYRTLLRSVMTPEQQQKYFGQPAGAGAPASGAPGYEWGKATDYLTPEGAPPVSRAVGAGVGVVADAGRAIGKGAAEVAGGAAWLVKGSDPQAQVLTADGRDLRGGTPEYDAYMAQRKAARPPAGVQPTTQPSVTAEQRTTKQAIHALSLYHMYGPLVPDKVNPSFLAAWGLDDNDPKGRAAAAGNLSGANIRYARDIGGFGVAIAHVFGSGDPSMAGAVIGELAKQAGQKPPENLMSWPDVMTGDSEQDAILKRAWIKYADNLEFATANYEVPTTLDMEERMLGLLTQIKTTTFEAGVEASTAEQIVNQALRHQGKAMVSVIMAGGDPTGMTSYYKMAESPGVDTLTVGAIEEGLTHWAEFQLDRKRKLAIYAVGQMEKGEGLSPRWIAQHMPEGLRGVVDSVNDLIGMGGAPGGAVGATLRNQESRQLNYENLKRFGTAFQELVYDMKAGTMSPDEALATIHDPATGRFYMPQTDPETGMVTRSDIPLEQAIGESNLTHLTAYMDMTGGSQGSFVGNLSGKIRHAGDEARIRAEVGQTALGDMRTRIKEIRDRPTLTEEEFLSIAGPPAEVREISGGEGSVIGYWDQILRQKKAEDQKIKLRDESKGTSVSIGLGGGEFQAPEMPQTKPRQPTARPSGPPSYGIGGDQQQSGGRSIYGGGGYGTTPIKPPQQ